VRFETRKDKITAVGVAVAIGLTGAVVTAPKLPNAAAAYVAASAVGIPAVPTGAHATVTGTNVRVDWNPPRGVTDFRVAYSSNSGSTWSSSVKVSTPYYVYRNLAVGKSYVFRVRSNVAGVLSPWSGKTTPVTVYATPTPAPTATAPVVTPTPTAPVTTPTPTTTPTVTATPTATPTTPTAGVWAPAKGTAWQWQLSGVLDTTIPVPVYDVDGDDTSSATVTALHNKDVKTICYFDAGGWENYRSDADQFPTVALGNTINGWPDERWIDIRNTAIIPLMEQRIINCKNKGFNAIEPDVVDGYANNTGFPLTSSDQIKYNKTIAELAHKHGLGVALKNDPDQAAALEPFFDFAVVEECFKYSECDAYIPFTKAGKAVLHVEYSSTPAQFCPVTKPLGFSSMVKKLTLSAWREVCP
jgi:hypothetical protein